MYFPEDVFKLIISYLPKRQMHPCAKMIEKLILRRFKMYYLDAGDDESIYRYILRNAWKNREKNRNKNYIIGQRKSERIRYNNEEEENKSVCLCGSAYYAKNKKRHLESSKHMKKIEQFRKKT